MLVAMRMKLADILVVDPDPDMVDVITAVLAGEGYPSRSASNGQQALDACAHGLPAVVLMDAQLPVVNGWMCATWLRARYGDALRIVVMTATRHSAEHRARSAADVVLTKPFALDQLVRVVARFAAPVEALVGRRRRAART